ncbi:MAG: hypothetical protein HZB46_11410 [Solirubrobacterales bacterium]|nr:hypothetical protein [Solirubrobacterales bacterium]
MPGWKQNGGCSGTPNIKGTKVVPAPTLTMPPSNGQLKAVADYVYTGNRCLDFKSNGSFDMYTNITCTGTATNVAPSGASVIYVDHSGACSGGYQYIQKYNNPATCGDVAVKGTYARNFTVGAANDVIIRGNLQKSGDTMMGLVANNFVRVYHPVTRDSSNNCTGNAAGTLSNPQIEAAILALQQSFIVDNWDCGATLGSLTVTGAIAQKWRGPVGTGSGGGATTGYVKDYNYDDRLRYKSPPQFLDPVQSAWRTVRRSELQPAK